MTQANRLRVVNVLTPTLSRMHMLGNNTQPKKLRKPLQKAFFFLSLSAPYTCVYRME